jgi:hypothetical protein
MRALRLQWSQAFSFVCEVTLNSTFSFCLPERMGSFWAYIASQDPSDSNPTGYMLTSPGFAFIHSRYILQILLKQSVILLKSRTSTGYSSNSTGSSATNRRFLPEQWSPRCLIMQQRPVWKHVNDLLRWRSIRNNSKEDDHLSNGKLICTYHGQAFIARGATNMPVVVSDHCKIPIQFGTMCIYIHLLGWVATYS